MTIVMPDPPPPPLDLHELGILLTILALIILTSAAVYQVTQ